MTQCEKILRHLRDFGQITPIEALADYGVMRLGARIWDLKRQGYAISSELVEGTNRYGERTHFARYRMKGAGA